MRFTSGYICIDLMQITPPLTAEGLDGSHHPRYAEWYIYKCFVSISDSDYPVSFRNVPSIPMMVLENTANYTTLYKFEYEDLDQNDTKYFSLAFNDVRLSRYFSIDFDSKCPLFNS